jgi:hypothetical protein
VRDISIPLAGVALIFYLAVTHQFEWWQLPILAGMMMVPLVGRGGEPDPDVRPDRRPEAEG